MRGGEKEGKGSVTALEANCRALNSAEERGEKEEKKSLEAPKGTGGREGEKGNPFRYQQMKKSSHLYAHHRRREKGESTGEPL